MIEQKSAASTRRYVVIHEAGGVGPYDYRWCTSLSVRTDGLRFRYFHSGFRWDGNQGGAHDVELYLSPADARQRWDDNFADQHKESFDEVVAAALKR